MIGNLSRSFPRVEDGEFPRESTQAADNYKPRAINLTDSAVELFEQLRQQWKLALTGEDHDSNHPAILTAIGSLSNTAEEYLKTIQPNASQIWPDLSPIYLSSYSINGTTVYHDNKVLQIIIKSLDFITAEAYNSSTIVNKNENWWNYKIGASRPLIDIGILLFDELGENRRQEYTRTVTRMIGNLDNPSLTGSNRANMCQVIIGASVLIRNSDELERGRSALFDVNGGGAKSVLAYVDNEDGFLDDGSYISHHVYPYTGGYGLTHILAVSQVAFTLYGTPFALTNTNLSMIFRSVRETFAPFVFRGMIMGNVRGRAVSRKDDSDLTRGYQLLEAVLRLSAIAPAGFSADFKSLLLSWQAGENFVSAGGSGTFIASSISRLELDENAPISFRNTGFRILPRSDRVVFHQLNWSGSLALSSTRTGRYEALNSENLRPFYQGDGFLQVYLDNDRRHFLDDYYPTMDPYHTPGVTAGQNKQELVQYRSTAHTAWAGGVKWRDLGAASLDYFSNDKLVSAKKSWFFLDHTIVALGISCSGMNDTEIHTTVEARKSRSNSPTLVADSDNQEVSSHTTTHHQPRWAHLEGVGGYRFLDSGSMTFEQANRTGRWTDINHYPDYAKYNNSITREYTTIYRNHSLDSGVGVYAYAILPNLTISETEKLAREPDFYVVSNTDGVQAVTFHRNQTVMATFWNPGRVQDLVAMTPCQVAWGFSEETKHEFILTLADPSQEVSRVEVRLRSPGVGNVLSKDPEMNISDSDDGEIHIQVDSRESHGRTFEAVFQYDLEPKQGYSPLSWILLLAVLMVILVALLDYHKDTLTKSIRDRVQVLRGSFFIDRSAKYSLLMDDMSSPEETAVSPCDKD